MGGGGGTGELTGQLSRLQQFTSTRGSNPTLPGGGGASVGPSVWSQLICSRCLDPNELFLHVLEVIWLWFGEPALNTFNLGLFAQSPQEFQTIKVEDQSQSPSSCFGSAGPDQPTGLKWTNMDGKSWKD